MVKNKNYLSIVDFTIQNKAFDMEKRSILIIAVVSIIVIGASLTIVYNTALQNDIQYSEKIDIEFFHQFKEPLDIYVKSGMTTRGAFCDEIFCGEDDFYSKLEAGSEDNVTEVRNIESGDRIIIRRPKVDSTVTGLALSLGTKDYTVVSPLSYLRNKPNYLELIIQVDGIVIKPEPRTIHVIGHICDPDDPTCSGEGS